MTDRGARDRSTPTENRVTPAKSESSVMFSLRELMDLEGARIAEEHAAEEQARHEQQRAKMEAELRMAAADEARRRADAERVRHEEAGRREDEARLDAIRLAAIERARLETLEAGRLAQLEIEHKHHAEILRLKGDRDRVRMKRTLVAVAVLGVGVASAALGWHFGVVKPRAEAEQIALQQKSAQLEQDRLQREQDLEKLAKRNAMLQEDLASIPTVVAPVAPPPATAKPSATGWTKPIPTAKPTASAKVCNPNDPMDFCLSIPKKR